MLVMVYTIYGLIMAAAAKVDKFRQKKNWEEERNNRREEMKFLAAFFQIKNEL